MGRWLRRKATRGRGRPKKNATKPESPTQPLIHELEIVPGTSTTSEDLVPKTPSIQTTNFRRLEPIAGCSKQQDDDIYEDDSQNVAPNQQGVSRSSGEVLNKDLFDQLFGNDPQNDLTVNKTKIKTYTNKKRKRLAEDEQKDRILEFHDCKNRDNIIQWLNDNSNVFDRLTQTQTTYDHSEDDEIPLTLDMPSVSQVNTVVKSTKPRRTGLRSSPTTRARSLDIQVTKNSKRGRLKRHSLAGDSPTIDDYTIEETYTDDDAPPVQDAKILLNLMEDDYLSTLEKEMETKIDDQGWGRINEIKKTIKKTMKEPKKLNITLQISPTRKEDVQNFPTYSLSVVEDFLSTHIEKAEGYKENKIFFCKLDTNPVVSSSLSRGVDEAVAPSGGVNEAVAPPGGVDEAVASPGGVSEKSKIVKAFEKAQQFIDVIKTLQSKELDQLFPLFLSIKSFFENKKADSAIQTTSISYVHKASETERVLSREAGNQTSDLEIAKLAPTTLVSQGTNDEREGARVVLETSSETQPSGNSLPVITNLGNEIESNNLYLNNGEFDSIDDKGSKLPATDKSRSKTPEFNHESQKFDMDDDFFDNFNFDTEEMVKSFVKERSQKSLNSSIENEPEIVEFVKDRSQMSPNISIENEPEIVGFVKDRSQMSRNSAIENGPEIVGFVKVRSQMSRNSAIENGLEIVGFVKVRSQMSPNSSVEIEPEIVEIIEDGPSVKTGSYLESLVASVKEDLKKGVKRTRPQTPNDLDEGNSKRPCERFIDEDLSVAFDSGTQNFENEPEEIIIISPEGDDPPVRDENLVIVPTPQARTKRSRTQEIIEECDQLIYEATKSSAFKPKQPISGTSSDGFAANSLFSNEENISKMEKDINEALASRVEEFDVGNKTSRRSLFSNGSRRENDKASESIFTSDISNEINNVTITENNVNNAVLRNLATSSDNEIDEEITSITSSVKVIKVLQNVVLKRSDSDLDEENRSLTSDDTLLSDVDIVETTPQKKFPSFSDQRGHLLDITLPPPLQFQDTLVETPDVSGVTRLEPAGRTPRPRSPLAKIFNHSTPRSQKPASEKMLSLSPIETRVVGLFDQVQQSEFSPLVIVSNKVQRSAHKPAATKQKSILNYISQTSQEISPSPTKPSKPCIACTRISKDQVIAISSLTNKKLATYSTSFSSKVTHLIVSVNEKNCIKDHTIKFVSGVAAGIWILSFHWVQECLNKNQIVAEEPYEALDVSGVDGPRQSRLNRTKNPLFKGYKIYAAPPLLSTTQKDVENIIKLLGGKTVARSEDLLDDDSSIRVIITEARATQDFDLYETWLEVFRVVTVDIEWLSRSVGQYKVLSLRPFTLCSDDSIASLGYPAELLINVPFSFSQNSYSMPVN